MQNRGLAIAIAVLGVAVAVVLFIALSGDEDSGSEPTSTSVESGSTKPGGGSQDAERPAPATIVVENGEPVGGVQELTFSEGGEIRFVVESDVSDEVHFHGYDVGKEVEAGGRVEFEVPATLTGEFEVELEQRVVPIAEITVNPS